MEPTRGMPCAPRAGRCEGQTVLIVGYGAIGKRLAELLRPFNVRVIAFRRKPRGDEGIPMVNASELNDALGEGSGSCRQYPSGQRRDSLFL